MSGRKLSEDQIAQAVRLRERGWGYKSIGARLGVSQGAILYQCLKHGAVPPVRPGRRTCRETPAEFTAWGGGRCRRFTPDEDRELVALATEGIRVAEICRRIGRAPTSVRIRLLQLAQREDAAA